LQAEVEAQDLLEMGMKKLEVKRLTDATGAVTRRDAWGLKLRLQLRLLFTAWGSATWRAPRACVCVCVCGGGGGHIETHQPVRRCKPTHYKSIIV
jgi:hypothetical protein